MKDENFWVGIDWGSAGHQVCVLDSNRTVRIAATVRHQAEALERLTSELLELVGGDAARLSVAIESPRNGVVETLMGRGIAVFAINPKQLDRFRDRHTVAGAKDDRRDAFVLADSLRTDQAAFRKVEEADPAYVQLRELGRTRDSMVAERIALGNRLREYLVRYMPAVLELGSVHDSPWLWELLELASTPELARKLPLGKVRRLLKEYRVRSITAEEVCQVLRGEPLHVAPGIRESFGLNVRLTLPRLRTVNDQLKAADRRLEEILQELSRPLDDASPENAGKVEHRDAALILSMKGVGTIICATMLGEAWQPLKARDYDTLRAVSGLAPVTKQSGKSHQVHMRYACNQRLRFATRNWAACAIAYDPVAKAHYARLRARGHKHDRALRGVADRLVGTLIGVLKSGDPYDPSRRRVVATQAAA